MHLQLNLRSLGFAIWATGIFSAGHAANAQGTNDSKLPAEQELQFKVSNAVLDGRCNEAKTLALLGGRLDLADQAMRLCVPNTERLDGPKPELPAPVSSGINKRTVNKLVDNKNGTLQETLPVAEGSLRPVHLKKEYNPVDAAETICKGIAERLAPNKKSVFGLQKSDAAKAESGCLTLYSDIFRRGIQVPLSPNQDKYFIEKPEWLRAPKGSDYASFYPKGAIKSGAWGWVQMRCVVTVTGNLEKCTILHESPVGAGFGEASQQMVMRNWKMNPKIVEGKPIEASWQTGITWVLPSY